MNFHIGVVGLGAMGSAATAALARRGARVVAFDAFQPPHTLGSTHGHTRIIREAYYEHPLYVPLVRRAYELWQDLERDSGETLLLKTGGLMVGPESGPLVSGARDSATRHDIPHTMLDARALRDRFPAYRAQPHWVGLHEHRAGILFPERCVAALLDSARSFGAELRTGMRVRGWRRNGERLLVDNDGEPCEVDRLVIAAGPWLPSLAASLDTPLPLEIERQLSHWFRPRAGADAFAPDRCPIALWETGDDGGLFATFPDVGNGVKCGTHHAGSSTTPESVDRRVSDAENEVARALLETVMPGAGGTVAESRVCLYTNTPDHHFIVDWTNAGRVLLLSPCSGHGFKFASAIGELAAQMLLDNDSWLDLSPFSLSRFG